MRRFQISKAGKRATAMESDRDGVIKRVKRNANVTSLGSEASNASMVDDVVCGPPSGQPLGRQTPHEYAAQSVWDMNETRATSWWPDRSAGGTTVDRLRAVQARGPGQVPRVRGAVILLSRLPYERARSKSIGRGGVRRR